MIQYTNIQNQPVTEQQFQSMQEYKIFNIEDSTGKVKLIEKKRVVNKIGIMRSFEYFLSPNEDKNTIIQEYINKEHFYGITIFMNKQSAYGFDLWEYEYYPKNGILSSKGKDVFDINNRIIASVSTNVQTDEVEYFPNPNKYLYFDSLTLTYDDPEDDDDIVKDVTIKFNYKVNSSTGESYFVAYLETKDAIYVDFINHFKFQDLLEMYPNFMQEHSYYSALFPLLPTSEVI